MKPTRCEPGGAWAFGLEWRGAERAAWAALMICGFLAAPALAGRPTIEVRSSHTVISQSCRVVIPAGTVLEDADGLGAIQISAPDIEIEFVKGSVLRGSPSPDTTGVGELPIAWRWITRKACGDWSFSTFRRLG